MAATNNNNLSASIPIFTGSDFWVWEQKMGDYLKSQHLWHITTSAPGSTWPVEAITGQPTPAEAQLEAAWDENLEQVQGIIGSHILQTLCPHIGTTCADTWTNLRTRFSTPGVSKIAADMYAVYLMKLSSTHNPHPDIKRMNMLFKQLNANGMTFSDAQQGLILLNVIPKEWATVAQIYSQSNWTLATTTFLGVRDTIMAKYEHASCPSTIAMHKISAVKHKGRSPTYTKQTHTKSAPPKASGDAPSGTPKKKTRRGGKVKAKVHAIVSSALVPPSVTKHLQETHHAAAPVAAPVSAPILASTTVGGPSHAPVWVPMTITSVKPSSITYTKVEAPKSAQAFSGFTGQEGLHTMRKPPVAWKGAAPSKPPVSLEARMACTTIVENAVVSSSHQTLDPPPAPLLEHIVMPTPADYAEHDAREKAKRKKTHWGNKKAKKDSVHSTPLDPSKKGKNVKVFNEKPVGNPIAENGEMLFIPDPRGYNHNDIKVNPKYPRAPYFWLLIDSLTQDPSGKHFRRTYGLEQPTYNPYLDSPSDGEQDSSSEDEEKGCSPLLFTPPQDEDTIMDSWDDDKNDPMSYIYEDYSYWKYVSNFDINTVADRQQLLVALGSLSSSVDQ